MWQCAGSGGGGRLSWCLSLSRLNHRRRDVDKTGATRPDQTGREMGDLIYGTWENQTSRAEIEEHGKTLN